MSKKSRKYEVYDLRALRENLSYLRLNLREALGLRRPLLRRFRREEEVVVVEAPKSKSRHEALRKGYVKESYQPRTSRPFHDESPRAEVGDEQPPSEMKKHREIGLGLIPALREIFRQSAEQVRLETERKRMLLEYEKRKLEEKERKEKLKPNGWHY